MSTCTFTYGASSITIQAPKYPDEPGRQYPQVVGRTMGGGFQIADLGSGTVWERPKLYFREQSAADYAALKGFIESTVLFSTYAFTYTDPYATVHTSMRYLRGLEEWRCIKGKWNGTLEIEKDQSA